MTWFMPELIQLTSPQTRLDSPPRQTIPDVRGPGYRSAWLKHQLAPFFAISPRTGELLDFRKNSRFSILGGSKSFGSLGRVLQCGYYGKKCPIALPTSGKQNTYIAKTSSLLLISFFDLVLSLFRELPDCYVVS
ncbi:hypothetical protein M413DRAFT_443800 [Hebeloma cylindrosporum]|uniref:Uncharacterized protein n=1 Tax=Hebeloma cylindrosporum TaxID=76867 RepID=A0A0C2YPL3_HEBCY|nr:hypothetical protein M413DRAFT_443800 [Hebeloma cylindrosporum h7]